MDLPLLHFIQFLQKKSAISYLQTCNINLAFLSLVYSSTNKGKTGKSNTSVVHSLHTSQLVLLCPTEIWFESVGSFIALNSQSNTIGLRKNQPVWCSWYVLDAMFFTRGHKLFSLITSFPQLLFSATPILVFTSHAGCFMFAWVYFFWIPKYTACISLTCTKDAKCLFYLSYIGTDHWMWFSKSLKMLCFHFNEI